MNKNRPITVFLADDHPLLRIGLKLSLEQNEDVEVTGEAGDGFKAVEKIQANPPDVALIDIDMPGISGIGAIRILQKTVPQTKIIVLSTYSEEKYIKDAMQAGADGYVLKSTEIEELVKIITGFALGKPPVSPYLVNLAFDCGIEPEKKKENTLTKREKEILELISRGKGNKEISNTLFISSETVKSHVKNIFKKLKVKNRVEAAMTAKKNLV